jgi:hypothetical protein
MMTDQTTTNRSARQKRRGGADRRFELGPHSRLFRRGAVGGLNGNSAEAKYIKTVEAALIQHVGKPSVAERLLITRLARIMLRLSLMDEKIANGDASELDVKVIGGLDSALRCGLSRLGLKGSQHAQPSLAEHLAKLAAGGATE